MVRIHHLLFVPAILLAVLLTNGGTPAQAQMFNNVWKALGKGKNVVEAAETSAREPIPERFQGPSHELPKPPMRKARNNVLPEPSVRLRPSRVRQTDVSTISEPVDRRDVLQTFILGPGQRLNQIIEGLKQSVDALKENASSQLLKKQVNSLVQARDSLASFDSLLVGGLNHANIDQAEKEVNAAVDHFVRARSNLQDLENILNLLSRGSDLPTKKELFSVGHKINNFHASFAQELERRVSISTILSQQLARNPHQVVKIENIGPAGLEQLEGLDGRSQAFSRFLNSYPS